MVIFAIFFCRIEETGNLYFFQNLHLLSFPTIYSLPCFPLKWRAHEFFPGGHGRTPEKVRSNLKSIFNSFYQDKLMLKNAYFQGFLIKMMPFSAVLCLSVLVSHSSCILCLVGTDMCQDTWLMWAKWLGIKSLQRLI